MKLQIRLAHKGETGEQTLRDHLLGVASRARKHAAKLDLAAAGELIGLLHDLGKSSDAFQRYLLSFDPASGAEPQDELRGKLDHSTAGGQCILRYLPGGSDEGTLPGILARLLALCIASHHSGLIDCLLPEGEDALVRRLDKGDAKTRCREAWDTVDGEVRARAEELLQGQELLGELKAKIAALFRRTGKGPERDVQLGLLVRLLFSCLIDADRTDTADFERPRAAARRQGGVFESWPVLRQRLETGLAALASGGAPEVNTMRRAVSDQCLAAAQRPGGAYTLTVPTGGGKTLAALRFALAHAEKHALDRVIFVSPYISIVDQNAQVARGMLEPEDAAYGTVVLEHHSNLVEEDAGREHRRRKILAENWDAPVVFTTMAQVLESLFGGGPRAVRRAHAMAQAVLVFDEVQTLPLRMVHLFNNAVNLLTGSCGSTVLLCTATQPLLDEVDSGRGRLRLASSSELIGDVAGACKSLHRYAVYDHTERAWTHEEAANLVCSEAVDRGSCLAVVNTRNDARTLFELCRKLLPVEAHVAHLSTSMCPAHRTTVLSRLKGRLEARDGVPVVCVSTQLIEAGVDIDFASAVRDLSGLDSLAQAAGRCNRNGRRPEGGRVHIVRLPALPRGLDEIQKGQEVASELLGLWRREQPGKPFPLDDPEQMRAFYAKAFYRRAAEMSYTVKHKHKEDGVPRDTTLLDLLGSNKTALGDADRTGNRPVRTMLLQSFKTANDAFALIGPTQGVVVPWGPHGSASVGNLCASHDLAAEWQLLRAAQPYTISLYPSLLARLQKAGAVHEAGAGVWCLRPEHYDDDYGLRLQGGPLEGMFA